MRIVSTEAYGLDERLFRLGYIDCPVMQPIAYASLHQKGPVVDALHANSNHNLNAYATPSARAGGHPRPTATTSGRRAADNQED